MTNNTAERFKILIVDDAADNIEILNELLEDQYEIFFATSGGEGLKQVALILPDLILLDVVMPDMDGYSVCRKIKEDAAIRDIPVIFLTSCSDNEDLVQGFAAGAVDYITKPFQANELLARVNTHIQLRQARREVDQKNTALEAALEQNRMLVREVYHRVKNNLNVACSLLNLQKDLVKDNRDAALFEEARNRIQVMSGIHELLYRSTTLADISAEDFFGDILRKLIRTYDRRDIYPLVTCDNLKLTLNATIPCGLIVNELVTNSLKYAFPGGRKGSISLTLVRQGAGLVLTVQDDGVGLPGDLDIAKADSLGLVLVTSLVQQLGGTMEVRRGGGAVVVIRFPEK